MQDPGLDEFGARGDRQKSLLMIDLKNRLRNGALPDSYEKTGAPTKALARELGFDEAAGVTEGLAEGAARAKGRAYKGVRAAYSKGLPAVMDSASE